MLSAAAHAEPKGFIRGWSYAHFIDQDFEPHMYGDQTPHVDLSVRDPHWQTYHWLDQFEEDKALINRFYKADIIRKQYIENDLAYLVVGPNFYALGTKEQKRIARTIDNVYKMTERKRHGSYHLIDWKTDAQIGVYSRYGLTLQ